MRPILKWPGGKAKMARLIHDAFGDERPEGYVEPFAGGLACFFHLEQSSAFTGLQRAPILSDACGSLMLSYSVLQTRPDDLVAVLQKMTAGHTEPRAWTRDYYRIRAAFNAFRAIALKPVAAGRGAYLPDSDAGVKHAAQMLWVNRACFNGLWRTNRSGGFNASAGSYKTVKLDYPAMRMAGETFRRYATDLRWCDWRVSLSEARDGDWVFVDSPYLPLDSQANSFTGYSAIRPWGAQEHRELAFQCCLAARRGAKVVLTNHDSTLTHKIYARENGWEVYARPTLTRTISQSAQRMKATEVVLVLEPGRVQLPNNPNTQLSMLGDAPVALEDLHV